jgi:hypothetical protein
MAYFANVEKPNFGMFCHNSQIIAGGCMPGPGCSIKIRINRLSFTANRRKTLSQSEFKVFHARRLFPVFCSYRVHQHGRPGDAAGHADVFAQ